MDAKEYLMKIKSIKNRINFIDMEIEEALNKSQRAGAMCYDERVQTGEAVKEPAFIKALDKAQDRIDQYLKIKEEYEQIRFNAIRQIDLLSDGTDSEVIYKKYLQDKTLKQIANEMHYSEDSVYYHYSKGMKEFNRLRLWEA